MDEVLADFINRPVVEITPPGLVEGYGTAGR
jgi:hypothetical protein